VTEARSAFLQTQPIAAQSAALLPAAEQIFAELRRISTDGSGVTRQALGPRETAAHEVIGQFAREAGLHVEHDRAANLVVTLPGHEAEKAFIAIGSHLDSVPCGGNYDGAAGVVAGLLALAVLRRHAVVPPRTIKLFALRAEESAWFGKSWIGSHALFGLLSPADLAQPRNDSGRPLADHLRDVGADVPAIAAGHALLDPGKIAAFLEVHIEQGPVLAARDLPVGIVTAIYGNLRHRRVICRGESAHAGATPRELRRDAVVAIADLITRLDARWSEWLARGEQLVVTHGIVTTNAQEHAISRIAGEVTMSLEIRAEDSMTLKQFHGVVREEARAVAQRRDVAFEFDTPIVNSPAAMDPRWIGRLDTLCGEEGVTSMRMPSGAGHDAAVFSHAGVPTAMLFIRNRFGSHNPAEHMDLADFEVAIRILIRALLAPADVS
jgi:beta-ureidopropionase / N-carbamoyl-L-amino-acid hydrolase